jgi:hypothetical protein
MDTANSEQPLSEASPSVQAHLGILQGVIQRMAANSSACKAWCITVVSAVLVLVADKGKPDFAYIALIPTLLFFALDAYYLGHEKGFLKTYNEFVQKLHAGKAVPIDLFAVTPSGNLFIHQIRALSSFSVWGFYSTLLVLIAIARSLVLQ